MENKKKIIIIVSVIVGIFLLLLLIGFVIRPIVVSTAARKQVEEVILENDETGIQAYEEQEKNAFNQIFKSYETKDGEVSSKASVLMLFTTLANHNIEDEERLVDVNGTVVTPENLDELKQIITDDMSYNIKCIYSEDGYVETIELRYMAKDEESTEEN